jgi:hypothetical protein
MQSSCDCAAEGNGAGGATMLHGPRKPAMAVMTGVRDGCRLRFDFMTAFRERNFLPVFCEFLQDFEHRS